MILNACFIDSIHEIYGQPSYLESSLGKETTKNNINILHASWQTR